MSAESYEKQVYRFVKAKLIGRKIVDVGWIASKDAEENLGWDERPLFITLDNGTQLIPSSDPEGNSAGTLFTNDDVVQALVPL